MTIGRSRGEALIHLLGCVLNSGTHCVFLGCPASPQPTCVCRWLSLDSPLVVGGPPFLARSPGLTFLW